MKKQVFLLVVIGLILFTASACADKAIQISDSMNGQTVSAKVGDEIQVSLEGNPTTGYNWEVVEYDAAILTLSGEPEYQSDSKLVGAGGLVTYTFKASQAGTTTIKLIYHRSWEKDIPPEKTFEILVDVK